MDYQLAKNKIGDFVLDSVRLCIDDDYLSDDHEQVLYAVVHFVGSLMIIHGICSSHDDAVAVAHSNISSGLVSKVYVVVIKNSVGFYAKFENE